MVAIITPGTSIRRAFHYNENKLNEGVASCLLMENYLIGTDKKDENMKLKMLLKLASIRPDVEVNCVHITLNFAPEEMLSDDKMSEIAKVYMDKIGFGNQPFLVYRHHDSGHPHCHIVTTNIEMDGNRISLHHLGRLKSEPARKEIEQQFNLVRAEDHKKRLFYLKPVDVQKVQYGKSETKRAIEAVLENVLAKYKYTSIPELNALLSLYNVRAERGSEESRTYKKKGLAYRVIDRFGNAVGVPIKASLFYNKPTLKYLEKQFLANDVARQTDRAKTRSLIDFVLKSNRPKSFDSFTGALKKSGITAVLRTSKEGLVYGITYIDFKNKCVFNGSSLGKNYSAKGIQDQLGLTLNTRKEGIKSNILSVHNPTDNIHSKVSESIAKEPPLTDKSILDELLGYEYTSQTVPFHWKKKKKRKKK